MSQFYLCSISRNHNSQKDFSLFPTLHVRSQIISAEVAAPYPEPSKNLTECDKIMKVYFIRTESF